MKWLQSTEWKRKVEHAAGDSLEARVDSNQNDSSKIGLALKIAVFIVIT